MSPAPYSSVWNLYYTQYFYSMGARLQTLISIHGLNQRLGALGEGSRKTSGQKMSAEGEKKRKQIFYYHHQEKQREFHTKNVEKA